MTATTSAKGSGADGRYRLQARRRLAVLGALTLLAWVALFYALRRPAPAAPADTRGADMPVKAYLVATGVFAMPPAGQGPADFQQGQASAAASAAPLGAVVWTDQDAFETHGWRDLIQVGRVPYNRPPKIDFAREVAVFTWAVPGQAPEPVLSSTGLVLRRTALNHYAVELGVTPQTTGERVATPNAGGPMVPYALLTVPRTQWPVPAPPPTAPPVMVTLTR